MHGAREDDLYLVAVKLHLIGKSRDELRSALCHLVGLGERGCIAHSRRLEERADESFDIERSLLRLKLCDGSYKLLARGDIKSLVIQLCDKRGLEPEIDLVIYEPERSLRYPATVAHIARTLAESADLEHIAT